MLTQFPLSIAPQKLCLEESPNDEGATSKKIKIREEKKKKKLQSRIYYNMKRGKNREKKHQITGQEHGCNAKFEKTQALQKMPIFHFGERPRRPNWGTR